MWHYLIKNSFLGVLKYNSIKRSEGRCSLFCALDPDSGQIPPALLFWEHFHETLSFQVGCWYMMVCAAPACYMVSADLQIKMD